LRLGQLLAHYDVPGGYAAVASHIVGEGSRGNDGCQGQDPSQSSALTAPRAAGKFIHYAFTCPWLPITQASSYFPLFPNQPGKTSEKAVRALQILEESMKISLVFLVPEVDRFWIVNVTVGRAVAVGKTRYPRRICSRGKPFIAGRVLAGSRRLDFSRSCLFTFFWGEGPER
jgi:hypothetical protein